MQCSPHSIGRSQWEERVIPIRCVPIDKINLGEHHFVNREVRRPQIQIYQRLRIPFTRQNGLEVDADGDGNVGREENKEEDLRPSPLPHLSLEQKTTW
jgi:hypothetical protein